MGIKARCDKCGKHISVDDAFAGGVCRCPHCLAIVMVQAGDEATGASRRPHAPSVPPAMRADENIPMAKPVKTQSVMILVLAAIVLVMVIGGIWAAIYLRGTVTNAPSSGRSRQQPNYSASCDPNQAPTDDPDEEGLKVVAPVVYCIDTGSSMREMYDYAVAMTRISVRALSADEKISVMLCTEGADDDDASWHRFLPAQPCGGGSGGENAIKGELELVDRSGASDIGKSLTAAVATKPRTIVIFARKNVDSALPAAALAHRAGIHIITVALAADEDAQESLAKLAKSAGGESRAYSYGQLQQWLSKVDMD